MIENPYSSIQDHQSQMKLSLGKVMNSENMLLLLKNEKTKLSVCSAHSNHNYRSSMIVNS